MIRGFKGAYTCARVLEPGSVSCGRGADHAFDRSGVNDLVAAAVLLIQVVFAPHLPHSYCCFRLDVDGVWGVDDEEDRQQPQPQQPPLQQQPLQPQLQAQQELQPPQHRQQHPAGQVAGCAGAGSQVGLCGGAAVWQGG